MCIRDRFEHTIVNNDFPSDGLVIIYDDIAYGESLGRTAKFPRNAMAFKWTDETAETTLKEIEWSASRTGLINPVAIFEPVELEGTKVSRASVHNISIMESLKLGIGDTIKVFKANMIIPQIAENITQSGTVRIPEVCPVCGGKTRISDVNDVKSLYCDNEQCQAKHIKSFALLASRDALNIDGLSEATLEKFIQKGFLKRRGDIFRISRYKDEITSMEGFGEKSCTNMQAAIEKSRHVHPVNLIFALCIPLIGTDAGKKIVNAIGFDGFADRMRNATDFVDIDGIGQEKSGSILEWYANPKNSAMFEALIKELDIEKVDIKDMSEGSLNGKTFVITGDVHDFANRSEFKAYVESQGGKVTGSVSKKTDYLVNNDTESTSSKNKKAKELGIPVLNEVEMSYQLLPKDISIIGVTGSNGKTTTTTLIYEILKSAKKPVVLLSLIHI